MGKRYDWLTIFTGHGGILTFKDVTIMDSPLTMLMFSYRSDQEPTRAVIAFSKAHIIWFSVPEQESSCNQ